MSPLNKWDVEKLKVFHAASTHLNTSESRSDVRQLFHPDAFCIENKNHDNEGHILESRIEILFQQAYREGSTGTVVLPIVDSIRWFLVLQTCCWLLVNF